VSAFIMAQQMGGGADLSASIVVISTLVSVATIFAWIFALKQFALL
jgi:predicted permease